MMKQNRRGSKKRKRRRTMRIRLMLKFVCIVCIGVVIGVAIPVVMAVGTGGFVSVPVLYEDNTVHDTSVSSKSDTVDSKEKQIAEDRGALLESFPEVEEEYLILVNKEHRIPEAYEIEWGVLKKGGRYVDKRIVDKVEAFIGGAEEAGMEVQVISGYRNISKQQRLVDEDVERYLNQGMTYQEAYEETLKYTMPAGYSEHHTGLAVDIVACGYMGLDDKQAMREENMWLREHCAEYGFILRYPQGKEDITEVCYESWHFRYVGVEVATYITEHDLTFEEFMELYELQE